MPGFERGRKLDKVGQPEADTAELFFADVRLSAENVIGEVDRGFGYMMQRLVGERIGSAVNNLAHARQILDETSVYAKERRRSASRSARSRPTSSRWPSWSPRPRSPRRSWTRA